MTTVEETQMVKYESQQDEQVNQPLPVKTPGEHRSESIAHALDAAYQNASSLKLSEKEAQELSEDFPDEAFRLGAGGDPDLIYIEHAYLRQRLNKVLGVGASVPIRRREWKEEFQYYASTQQKWLPAVRVYVDLVLVVRGCLVSEAIGDAVYYPHNPKTNYSDALESAKSNAFRRCSKEFGVGLQAWMKGWSDGWKERNGANRKTTSPAPQATRQPQQTQQRQQSDKPAPAVEPGRLTGRLTGVSKWPLEKILALLTEAPDYKILSDLVDSIVDGDAWKELASRERILDAVRDQWKKLIAAKVADQPEVTNEFPKKMQAHREKLTLDKQFEETEKGWESQAQEKTEQPA